MTAIPFRHFQTRTPARRSMRYRINEAAQRAFATVQLWHRRSVERRQLAELDEHMLKDIGITHADALYLSSKPFWKE